MTVIFRRPRLPKFRLWRKSGTRSFAVKPKHQVWKHVTLESNQIMPGWNCTWKDRLWLHYFGFFPSDFSGWVLQGIVELFQNGTSRYAKRSWRRRHRTRTILLGIPQSQQERSLKNPVGVVRTLSPILAQRQNYFLSNYLFRSIANRLWTLECWQ